MLRIRGWCVFFIRIFESFRRNYFNFMPAIQCETTFQFFPKILSRCQIRNHWCDFFFLWKLKFIFGGDVINYFLELMIFVDILFVLGRDTIYKYLLTLLHDTNIYPRWNYRCIFINLYFSSLCKFVIFPREKFNIPNTSTPRIISYSSRG